MSESRPLHSLFDLSGQVALVTGGSRGLGLEMAEGLIRRWKNFEGEDFAPRDGSPI